MAFEIEKNILKKYIPEDDEKIVAVPEGITEIGDLAFERCSEIEKIILPDGIKKIGYCSFQRCGMKEISIPDGLEEVEMYAFSECTNLEFIKFPDSTKKFSWHILEYCRNPKEVVLPSGMREISQNFCRECSALEKVQLPETLQEIDRLAFSRCKNLKEIIFPDTVEMIGGGAFSGCESLVSVEIPARVTCLSSFVFGGCKNLQTVEILAGDKLWIDIGAFEKCALKEMNLPQVSCLYERAFDPDVILHIRTSDGIFTMQFGNWENHKDEKLVLKFLNYPEYRENDFQQIKKGNYKLLLANFMMQYHPEQEVYQAYVKRNIKKYIKMLIDGQDSETIRNLLSTGYVTKKNIDELINYALEKKKHEMQILLMNWKHENIKAESIEKQISKKLKL